MITTACCYPSRDEFVALSEDYNLIPVYREVVADMETPVSVYGKVFREGYSCLLESVEGSAKLSRYSFIAGDPFLSLKVVGKEIELTSDHQTMFKKDNLFSFLRQIMGRYKAASIPGLPRFFGGAVGYIGYDTVRFIENLPDELPDDLGVADTFLIFPESVIVFDHYSSKLQIIINVRVEGDSEGSYAKATEKIEQIIASIRKSSPDNSGQDQVRPSITKDLPVTSSFSREEFSTSVEKIKDYIYAGDILQTVLSQRFEKEVNADPFDVYRALRVINPSPYMYYLDCGEVRIAGASPEMLVRLEDGVVENRPIAGTRPRGKTAEADQRFEEELTADPKERAEHVMLVDLGRNDLGRVSQYGSVEVPVFMACERYSHVMHLVSEVKGVIRDDLDAFDALAAGFPAGTVSGAPKVKAMEIIDELEPTRRGPYAGAVGYFSFLGDMDTCITIRTIVFANGKAYAQAGAGIVADSQPENEFEETVNKAKVLMAAIKSAEEGLL